MRDKKIDDWIYGKMVNQTDAHADMPNAESAG